MSYTHKEHDFTDDSNSNMLTKKLGDTDPHFASTSGFSYTFSDLYTPNFVNSSGIKKFTYMSIQTDSSSAQNYRVQLTSTNGPSVLLFSGEVPPNKNIEIITRDTPIYVNGIDMKLQGFKVGTARLHWQYEEYEA